MVRAASRAGLAAACVAALALAAPVGGADAPPAPAPEAPAPAAPEAPPPRIRARVVVTDLAGDTRQTRVFTFYKLGNRTREEAPQATDPRFTAETLYDYDRRFSYRNLAADKITFAFRISLKERVLAQLMGFMTSPAEEPVYRLEVNRDVAFDGHPCTLVLTGFPAPGGRIHALRWVWEARDLDGQPVKVVFPRGDGSITIVEFLDATEAPFDPALVSVPEGRPVMSGF